MASAPCAARPRRLWRSAQSSNALFARCSRFSSSGSSPCSKVDPGLRQAVEQGPRPRPLAGLERRGGEALARASLVQPHEHVHVELVVAVDGREVRGAQIAALDLRAQRLDHLQRALDVAPRGAGDRRGRRGSRQAEERPRLRHAVAARPAERQRAGSKSWSPRRVRPGARGPRPCRPASALRRVDPQGFPATAGRPASARGSLGPDEAVDARAGPRRCAGGRSPAIAGCPAPRRGARPVRTGSGPFGIVAGGEIRLTQVEEHVDRDVLEPCRLEQLQGALPVLEGGARSRPCPGRRARCRSGCSPPRRTSPMGSRRRQRGGKLVHRLLILAPAALQPRVERPG